MAKGVDLDDVPTNSGDKRPRVGEIVDLVEFPHDKWVTVRLQGKAFVYGTHWVTTLKRDKKTEGRFPTPCLAFDPETGQQDSTKKCPWCKDASGKVGFRRDTFMNAIVRSKQRNAEPAETPTKAERRTGFKDKNSETFTIWGVVPLGPTLITHMKDLKSLNTVEDEESGETKAYAVSDIKYGRDVIIKFDKDEKGAKMWAVQGGDRKPIKKSEMAYLQWDLSNLVPMGENAYQEALKEYKSWKERNNVEDVPKNSSFDDDDDDTPKKSKKNKVVDEDEDDDDIDIRPAKKTKKVVDDDDEDDDPPPKKSTKKAKDDFDDDDEDDESPVKKKVAAKKSKSDDDDEDEFDDDEDVKPKKSTKKSSKVVDEDDEDDEPPPKKASKKPSKVIEDEDEDDDEPPAKKPAAKKGKKVVDEDDEDDFDDEPPKKSSAKKPVKKKVVDDDEDDDL